MLSYSLINDSDASGNDSDTSGSSDSENETLVEITSNWYHHLEVDGNRIFCASLQFNTQTEEIDLELTVKFSRRTKRLKLFRVFISRRV